MATTTYMTADDLFNLPDDGQRRELVRGRLVCMSPAGGRDSSIGTLISHFLWAYVLNRELGRVFGADGGFAIEQDPDTVYAPDAAFVRAERLPAEDEQIGYLYLAPDLVAEVISPSDRASELNAKVNHYLEAGVKLVWIVDPETRNVEVRRPDGSAVILDEDDELDGEDVLPGYRLPVAQIFR